MHPFREMRRGWALDVPGGEEHRQLNPSSGCSAHGPSGGSDRAPTNPLPDRQPESHRPGRAPFAGSIADSPVGLRTCLGGSPSRPAGRRGPGHAGVGNRPGVTFLFALQLIGCSSKQGHDQEQGHVVPGCMVLTVAPADCRLRAPISIHGDRRARPSPSGGCRWRFVETSAARNTPSTANSARSRPRRGDCDGVVAGLGLSDAAQRRRCSGSAAARLKSAERPGGGTTEVSGTERPGGCTAERGQRRGAAGRRHGAAGRRHGRARSAARVRRGSGTAEVSGAERPGGVAWRGVRSVPRAR